MLVYWLLSVLLSLFGWGVYVVALRRRLPVLHAKWVLVGMVVLSWMVPFLVPSLPEQTQALQQSYLPDYRQYEDWNVVDLQDQTLLSCYKSADNSKDQCHCEIEQQAEVLAYQSNPYYNFLLALKGPGIALFYGVFLLFLAQLLFRLACLVGLVMSSRVERRWLRGHWVWLLHPSNRWNLAISSFTLWRSYIVVPTGFEAQFTSEEWEAILLHELGHLQQRDTWQQVGLHLLHAVWWMNPVFYGIKKELHRLNEYAADDFAVRRLGNAKWYAKLLVKAKEQQVRQAGVPTLQLVLYAVQSLLRQRILRLIQQPQRRLAPHGLATLAVVGLLFWQMSATALPLLQAQDRALEQYERLKAQQGTVAEDTETLCPTCQQRRQ